jgi:tol-pal system protein YbgF
MSVKDRGLKFFLGAGLALGLSFLVGCATDGVVVGGSGMRQEIDALKIEVAELKDRARLSGGGVGGPQMGSDLRLEIDNLRASIQTLTENMETASIGGLTLRQQLEYISARLDRLEKKANLPALGREVVAPIPQLPPNDLQAYGLPSTAPDPPQVPVQRGPAAVAPPPAAAVKSAYDEGKELFDRKNYQAAVERFRAYIEREPTGSQVPGAQFYIGESLYFQNQYEEAILEYQTLVSGFPKNALVSTALLKQGLCFQSLGDKASAKLLFQKVVRDYPKSYSAGVAKERLKTL